MNVLFLGCGNMGGAMLQAWLPLAEQTWAELWILRISKQQREMLENRREYAALRRRFHFVSSFAELEAYAAQYGMPHFAQIILGLKPQVIEREFVRCLNFGRNSLWLTMAAALPLSWYQRHKPGLRILRIMPNLGARLGQSASLLYREPDLALSVEEESLLTALVQALGSFAWCESEAQLDGATPITGSGPAYYYLLTELLAQELQKCGFDFAAASELAEAVFLGAAAYLQEFRQSGNNDFAHSLPSILRGAVTSKAGVTEAALSVLQPALQNAIAEAVLHGVARGRELQKP